jgi:hypothetical protein
MQDHLKNYKISPIIREMIEQRQGKKPMSYVQIENTIKKILEGKYKNKIELLPTDKQKIIGILSLEFNPNNYTDDVLENLSLFMKDCLDKDQVNDFVIKTTSKFYKPGVVIQLHKVHHDSILHFISQFDHEMLDGIIINTKYLGDIKKIDENVKYDEETLEITDEEITGKINDVINNLEDSYPNDISIWFKDDIYVIGSKDENLTKELSEIGLTVSKLPLFFYKNWE